MCKKIDGLGHIFSPWAPTFPHGVGWEESVCWPLDLTTLSFEVSPRITIEAVSLVNQIKIQFSRVAVGNPISESRAISLQF